MSKSAILNYRRKHRPTCSYSIRLLKRLEELNEIKKNEKPLCGEVNNHKPLDFDLIEKAICFAKKYHDGRFRKSGEHFYTHPLEVAYLITDYNMTTNVIVTSILHDVVEDSIATVGMIVDNFGFRIAEMVDMLTRDRPDGTKLSVETILNNAYEKNDKEVLLIKCVDRLHNMQTIEAKNPEKQKKTSKETLGSVLYFTDNMDLEKSLNIKASLIFCPEKVNYLERLYSKSFFSDNFQLPSLV